MASIGHTPWIRAGLERGHVELDYGAMVSPRSNPATYGSCTFLLYRVLFDWHTPLQPPPPPPNHMRVVLVIAVD